jgi:hypothetical protein
MQLLERPTWAVANTRKLGLAINLVMDERKVLSQVSYSNVPKSIGCFCCDFFKWRLEGPDHQYFYVGMSTYVFSPPNLTQT